MTLPHRLGPHTISRVKSNVPIVGLHPDPFRSFAYMDEGQARRLGFSGQVNQVDVAPDPGISEQQLKRTLFAVPGVAGVERRHGKR